MDSAISSWVSKYVRALKANMNDIVMHVGRHIKYESTDDTYFKPDDPAHPIVSTKTMPRWYSRRKWLQDEDVEKCHLNVGVYDNNLEKAAMHELERNPAVVAWVKNDKHLGFGIPYHFKGAWHTYIPDFLARLNEDITVIIETKGAEEESAEKKQDALNEWVRVVNEDGNYGRWINCGMVRDVSELKESIHNANSCDMQPSGKEHRLLTAKCPSCGTESHTKEEVKDMFGFRNINGIKCRQSWCKKCRGN